MKKVWAIFFSFLLLVCFINKTQAMTFEQAFQESNKTPMVVLIYAQWADNYQNHIAQFRKSQSQLGSIYNYAELDIASNSAKYFNEKFHIYPKLPYVLMFKNGGKISRYIPRECASDLNCLNSKLKSFIQ